MEIDVTDLETFTIDLNHKKQLSRVADKKSNNDLEVVAYKMKVPGKPTISVKGNQVKFENYKDELKPRISIYIFDIEYKNPQTKEVVKNQTNPVVFEIK